MRRATPRVSANADSGRAACRVRLGAIRMNYREIRARSGGAKLLPMVKANGYGHGAGEVARALAGEANLAGFGVATLAEGIALRGTLEETRWRSARIVIFSGAMPWSRQVGEACERHGLTPVIASLEDLRAFVRGGWSRRLPYQIKFNTGMNRLGIQPEEASATAEALHRGPGPEGILTHLAEADRPRSLLTLSQIGAFAAIRSRFSASWPRAVFHAAGSAAIWRGRELGLLDSMDWVRPGLALYGVPPWAGATPGRLRLAIELEARVLSVRRLAGGERVGYGGEFQAPRAGATVAMVGVGYGDGILRALGGGRGAAVERKGGRLRRILGRVSMDLTAIEGEGLRAGDWVRFLGEGVDIWAQARAARTIPYELFTSLGARLPREWKGT